MKLLTPEEYPKHLKIKDTVYEVRFPKRMPKKDCSGFCDSGKRIIYIRQGLSLSETKAVFIHELLHALAYEYNIDISHAAVYGLETALSDLLLTNF